MPVTGARSCRDLHGRRRRGLLGLRIFEATGADDAFSCVVVSVPPQAVLANCTGIFRLRGGTIAFQTTAAPGPVPKQLAVTGGTGSHDNAGGDGTLTEFPNNTGTLTLHVLSLIARGG